MSDMYGRGKTMRLFLTLGAVLDTPQLMIVTAATSACCDYYRQKAIDILTTAEVEHTVDRSRNRITFENGSVVQFFSTANDKDAARGYDFFLAL